MAGDVASLEAALLRPEATPAQREEAAARLVSRGRAETDERLRAVLSSPDAPRDARLAVARALADDPTPAEAMVAPLAELMRLGAEQRSNALVDAAAAALTAYRRNPAALDELVRFAADPELPPEARARVVRLLGRVVEPAVADLLVRLLRDARENLRPAAADALADLTGIRDWGQDAARWQQWQRANEPVAAVNPDRWRADLLEVKAGRLERLRRRQDALLESLEARMVHQYQAAPREQRPELLAAFLESSHPDERAIGARQVSRAFLRNQDPITERVRERLIVLVGDSDPTVRFEVAQALRELNLRNALGAELTQLAQERDERVKLALIGAVGRIEDPAAAPQLVALLSDPSPRVVAAAAGALTRVGRDLRRAEGQLADRALERLRQIAFNRGAAPAVRAAALDALAVLQDPELIDLVQQRVLGVAQPEPSLAVRQAALAALGTLGNPAAAEIVTRTLRAETREPAVRGSALDALGRVGNLAEHGGLLLEYTLRNNEPDENVRLKAWEAYQALLPRADVQALTRELAGVRGDPVRHAVVLEELCRKLEQGQNPQDRDNLANFRVSLGEAYVKQEPPQLEKAIFNFRRALDHYLQNNAGEAVIEPLVRQLLDAYLKFKDYAQASNFAAQMIARDSRQKETVGSAIKNEADRLRSPTVGDTRSALALINEALKMDPPLDERHQQDLRQIRKEIERGQ